MAKHGIFNQPIAPKTRSTPEKFGGGKNQEAFKAPTKEEATTGRYMAAGDYYGTGFKNPVGRMRDGSGMNPVPQKKLAVDPNSVV